MSEKIYTISRIENLGILKFKIESRLDVSTENEVYISIKTIAFFSDWKEAELVCKLLNENEDLINGNYHSVYSEPKEHCMGHQTIQRKGSETILAETFNDAVAKIIVKAMNENENRLNKKLINYIRGENGK
jgi:hypothetical protein